MQKTYNWAIIGPGKIAHRFAESLKVIPNAQLYAVASRSKQRADDFAQKFNIPQVYTSYEDLIKDSNVDIVYIATTNNLHYQHTMLALTHNKAVLCEKPSTMSSAQLKEIIDYSAKHNVFYMEALWTRFLPTILKVDELIKSKKIGDLKHVIADFGFKAEFSKENRLFNKELGGGSIWDIGLYPVFLALHILGKPDNIISVQNNVEEGVDISTSCIFQYKNGNTAMLFSTFDSPTMTEAKIIGDKGCLKLHQSFHIPTQLSFHHWDENENIELNYESNGYSYEAREVMQCLDKNLIESPMMSHQFSLLLLETLEQIISKAIS